MEKSETNKPAPDMAENLWLEIHAYCKALRNNEEAGQTDHEATMMRSHIALTTAKENLGSAIRAALTPMPAPDMAEIKRKVREYGYARYYLAIASEVNFSERYDTEKTAEAALLTAICALVQRNAELEAGLRPFANKQVSCMQLNDADPFYVLVTFAEFCHARSLLPNTSAEPEVKS